MFLCHGAYISLAEIQIFFSGKTGFNICLCPLHLHSLFSLLKSFKKYEKFSDNFIL